MPTVDVAYCSSICSIFLSAAVFKCSGFFFGLCLLKELGDAFEEVAEAAIEGAEGDLSNMLTVASGLM
jgi:hypothetical protein